MATPYTSGEEVQVKSSSLWQIGSFIQQNLDGTFRVRISRKEVVNVPAWCVKKNYKEYQDDDETQKLTRKSS